MSSAHTPTPGPWHVGGLFSPGTPDAHYTIWSETPPGYQSGDMVARYVAPRDAALITAAPELLELARGVALHFRGTDAPLGVLARELIAVAEGVSQCCCIRHAGVPMDIGSSVEVLVATSRQHPCDLSSVRYVVTEAQS